MKKSTKALKIPIRVAIVALLCGVLMRVLNLPYTEGVMFISFMAIGILYALRFTRKEQKQSVDFIKMILVLFWTTNGLLKILDFPYTLFFQIGTAITFITWFAMEGTAYFMDEDRTAKNSFIEVIWNCAMVIGVLTIISGGLMHFLNWGYAIPTLTIGLTIVTGYILKDVFNPTKEKNKDTSNEELGF